MQQNQWLVSRSEVSFKLQDNNYLYSTPIATAIKGAS